jgi:dienelactone hydrolase
VVGTLPRGDKLRYLPSLPDLAAKLPKALSEKTRFVRLAGDIPALLAHPDWETPAPTVIWMHGRTANKELDPGRYLRWIRAGIAACAVDLPGHGERADPTLTGPEHTVRLVSQMVVEIDSIVAALAESRFGGIFDHAKLGIGGMSAGGMATLRRLCDPHPFKAAAVEATTGWLSWLYFSEVRQESGDGDQVPARWIAKQKREAVETIDAVSHLDTFEPLPILVLHTETDAVVPIRGMRRFVELLEQKYTFAGADEGLIEVKTWANTGAPEEHAGFGKFGNDAKNAQIAFFSRVFGLARSE